MGGGESKSASGGVDYSGAFEASMGGGVGAAGEVAERCTTACGVRSRHV